MDEVTFGVHYNRSFLPVDEIQFYDENFVLGGIVKEYHQNFQVTVGYLISLENKKK